MTKELRRCPFCGGEAKVSLFLGYYGVACTECLGTMMPGYKTTKEESIEAWNRRTPMDDIVNELECEKTSIKNLKEFHKDNSLGDLYCDGQTKAYEYAIDVIKDIGGSNE